MFAENEDIEEIGTTDLKYLIAPALLGDVVCLEGDIAIR